MEPLTIIALALVAAGIGYTIFTGSKQGDPPQIAHSVQASYSLGNPTTLLKSPGRTMMDQCDELGKDRAAVIIGNAFGQVEAEDFSARLNRAINKITPSPPAPTPAITQAPAPVPNATP